MVVSPTPSGRAQFFAATPRAPEQQPTPAYPLILNTGRVRDQWHTMSRTGLAAKLFSHTFAPLLQMHPADAGARGIESGDLVRVANTRGEICLLADVTEDTQQGLMFAPIHWNDQFAYRANVSQVMAPTTDPVSGQPESKHAAVCCERIDVGCWARIVSTTPMDADNLTTTKGLQYWVGSPVTGGWQYEFAMEDLSPLLSHLTSESVAQFSDSRGGWHMLGRRNDKACWLLFAAPVRSRVPSLAHIALQLQSPISDWLKLSPLAAGQQDTSPMICTCFEVREAAILRQIEAGIGTASQLGKVLHCGTNCGSCVPEINKLVAETASCLPEQAVGA